MTTKSISSFWRDLTTRATTTYAGPSSCFRSGHASFSVCGPGNDAIANLQRHFFPSDPAPDTIALYQFFDPALFDFALKECGTNWFQKTIIAFRENGLFGFLNEELGLLEAYDPKGKIAVRLLRDENAVPAWERSSPLANFVNWFNVSQNAYMLHGASLSNGQRGVLAVADGGTGKSLLTLSCLEAGLLTAGDDYAVVRQKASGEFDAACFSRVAKQTAEGLEMLGVQGGKYAVGKRNFKGKYVFDIPVHPSAVPINAVLLLTRAQDDPAIVPAKARDVFAAISQTTFHQLPASAVETQTFAGQLVRALPTYQFSLGIDLFENAKLMKKFLRDFDV